MTLLEIQKVGGQAKDPVVKCFAFTTRQANYGVNPLWSTQEFTGVKTYIMEIKENIRLAPYTMYKIGGPAKFFVEVQSSEELKSALLFSLEKNLPFFILGAGTNTLVSDQGFNGLVIKIKDGKIKIDGEIITIDAGVMMARAVLESAKAGLTGFEWGVGVPGSFGGSVRGNAGCFGGEIKDIVSEVEIFDTKNKKEFILKNTECEFKYRHSIFKERPEWVILCGTVSLQEDRIEKIQEKIKKITLERSSKQDIGTQSCGCIFKNISWMGLDREKLSKKFPELEKFKDRENIPASFLIDRSGLKNTRVGKIIISPKHANFFVNEGGGTAQEVLELIKMTKKSVKKKFGLEIQEEIQYIGF